MAIKIGNAAANITIEGADQAWIVDLIEEHQTIALRVLEEEIKKIYDDAYEAWPKPGSFLYNSSRSAKGSRYARQRSPHIKRRTEPASAEGLEWEVRIDDGGAVLVGRVWNDVSYAKFIKANDLAGLSVFVELLRKPMGKLRRRLPKLVEEAISEASDG